jgi:hypothetical protein
LSRWPGGLILLLLSCAASAIERVELGWATLESPGWRAQDIHVELDWGGAGTSRLTLSVALAEIGSERVRDLRLTCGTFELSAEAVQCRDGELALASEWLEAQKVPVQVDYRFASGELSVSMNRLPIAGGAVELKVRQRADAWALSARIRDARLAQVAALAAKAGITLPALTLAGTLGGRVEARLDSGGLQEIDWQLQTHQAGYSNAEGDQAAEALQLTSRGRATPQAEDWRVQGSIEARGGMLYSDPLYLEFSTARPLAVEAGLRWRAASTELRIDSLTLEQPGVTRGRVEGVLAMGTGQPLRRLDLELDEAQLPEFYSIWMQPWLAGSVLGKLDTSGRLQGRLHLEDGRLRSARLALERVSFGERSGLFGVQALDGTLAWEAGGERHRSRLAWEGAHFHQLLLGAAALELETGPDGLRITEPLAVPLLDGALQVEEFELGRDGEGQARWLLDATLTPVSMEAFTAALGWPTMGGTLSGVVPRVRYEAGEVTVGGTLLVQVFGGDVTVRNLRIQRPLGLVPRLWADVRLNGLDLETLTRTFSFGRIEGRLQGEVENLYMEAWQLVAFDAHFETPPDDDSRHRISQRAVDNISNLGGGGVGGALSRGFLTLFEDFPYRRLGIRCRLENGVCRMGGVVPAENGYYLVQGRWLPPRLDVIGYAEKVDWQSLVDRLVAVTRGETPRIQ